jgi:hemerythrin superfamily protein
MATPTRDALDVLIDDHRRMQQLVEELREPGTDGRARDLADLAISAIVRHSVAEEMYIYPAMKTYLPDGERAVEHDVAEHQQLEELLKTLEHLDETDPQFAATVAQIDATLADHVADEEHDQFPALRAAVPAETLQQLAAKVEMAERIAPTRPHPAAPHHELFHKTVGTGVGLVDRLKDALTGRMTE